MIVVGIDPSLTSTGIACGGLASTVPGVEASGNGLQLDRVMTTAHRIYVAGITAAPDLRDDHLYIIETPSVNAKGASHERIVGLHYLLRSLLVTGSGRVVDVAAATLKVFATGSGRADKFDMILAARERLGYEGKSDDEADALWLQQLGHHLLADDRAVKLPQTHTRALAKIHWERAA